MQYAYPYVYMCIFMNGVYVYICIYNEIKV